MAATTVTADADFWLNSGIPSMMFRSSHAPKRVGKGRNDTDVVRVGCIHDVSSNFATYPTIEGRLRPRQLGLSMLILG